MRTPDRAFVKTRFDVSYGVPALLSNAVLLAYVVRFPTAAPALVLPFYLGCLWFALLVLRGTAGTLAQTLERGLRLHEPALRAPSS